MEQPQLLAVLESLAKKDGSLVELKKLLKDQSFLEGIAEETVDYFEMMILQTIIFRQEVSYLVSPDGECLPYQFAKHDRLIRETPELELVMKSPHIVLSLSQAYSQLIQDWSEKKWFDDVSIVTKDEQKILKLLREESTKDLQIIKNNGEIDRLVLTQEKSLSSVKQFANHIVRNGYQTIILSTRNGKPVKFINKVSIKLNNVPE